MKDFDILYKEGRFVGGKTVNAKVWKIDPEKHPRREYTSKTLLIGFVVGVKIDKRAVKRNRAKRQMREVVRLLLKEGVLKTGYMIAFMGQAGSVDAEYTDIEKSVVEILKKARVLK